MLWRSESLQVLQEGAIWGLPVQQSPICGASGMEDRGDTPQSGQGPAPKGSPLLLPPIDVMPSPPRGLAPRFSFSTADAHLSGRVYAYFLRKSLADYNLRGSCNRRD